MSFQKCPICEGFGTRNESPCPTCAGRRVISDITGLPPDIITVAPGGAVPDVKSEEIVTPVSPFDDLTDEEIIYFSTPYYDELQAKKEKQLKDREKDQE